MWWAKDKTTREVNRMSEKNVVGKIVKDGLEEMDESTISEIASEILNEKIGEIDPSEVDKAIEEAMSKRLEEIVDDVFVEEMVELLDNSMARVLEKKIEKRMGINSPSSTNEVPGLIRHRR